MTSKLHNLTLFRFNYPYYFKHSKEPYFYYFDNEYLKTKNLVIDVDIHYQFKVEKRLITTHFAVPNCAKIDNIKYNKIVGSINLDAIVDYARRDFADSSRIFSDMVDPLIKRHKSSALNDKLFLYFQIINADPVKFANSNHILHVNLTKKNMKNLIW